MDGFREFKAQFARLSRLLRARGRRPDEAEDAVQEAYARLLKYVAEGHEVREPEAFLTQVAYNVASDGRRRHGVRFADSRPIEQIGLLEGRAGPEEKATTDDLVHQIQLELDRAIGERARKVYFLHCYDEFTYAEIAKQIGMSVRTVEKDLIKANKALAAFEIQKRLRQ